VTQPWRIGEIAAHCGISPKAIRYYEQLGLLPPPERNGAGYRMYREPDRERLAFIGKAKSLGLSLADIREILAMRAAGAEPCTHVVGLIDRKLAEVESQLRALRRFRQDLLILRRRSFSLSRAEGCICHIIDRGAVSHPLGTVALRQPSGRFPAATP
jgi:DNA-binding transcriptional MerR regulator